MNNGKKFSPHEIMEELSILEKKLIDEKIENLDENEFLENIQNRINKNEFSKEHIVEITNKIKKIRANIVLIKERLNENSKKLLDQKTQFSSYVKNSNLVK